MTFSTKGWFWFLVLLVFLVIILKDDSLEKDVRSSYAKARMRLSDVHFSEIDQGFEHARLYADEVDMDDSQNNMNATQVRTLFFDKQVATRTGQLVASWAFKTPFEARFWGDVRLRSSDGERLRTDELRYFFSRKEMYTSMPVTIWKDDMIITGREFRFNTQTRAGSLERDVLIRIWPAASATAQASATPSGDGASFEETGHFVEIPSSQFEEEPAPGLASGPDGNEPGPTAPPMGIPKPTPPRPPTSSLPPAVEPASQTAAPAAAPQVATPTTRLPAPSPVTTAPARPRPPRRTNRR